MSATTAASTGLPADAPRPAFMPRLLSFFSGTVGVVCKLALLSLSNAIAVWAAVVLIGRSDWIAVGVLAAGTVAIDLLHFGRRTLPAKFPGPRAPFMAAVPIIPSRLT